LKLSEKQETRERLNSYNDNEEEEAQARTWMMFMKKDDFKL
jgi:hypothetical protein